MMLVLAVVFTLDTLILKYGTDGSQFEWLWQTSYKEQSDFHTGWTHQFYHYWYVSKITNGITAFVGVMNVILIAKRKITNYFWGVLSCIFYGNYAFSAGYTGDALLNIFFYLPMSFWGWKLWIKNYDLKNDVVEVNKFKWWYLIVLSAFLAVFTVSWYYLIPVVDENLRIWLFKDHYGYYFAEELWPHILDAFTNALGVASTLPMYFRFGQEFMLYMINDILGIIMWSGIFELLTFDLSMMIKMTAYFMAGAAGMWVWMDATPTGRMFKQKVFFKTY